MTRYCNGTLVERLTALKIAVEIAVLLTALALLLAGRDDRAEAAKTLLEAQRLVAFQNQQAQAVLKESPQNE